jgi:hypothetical protein
MKQHDRVEISLDLTPAQLLTWTTLIMFFWPFVVVFCTCCLMPPATGGWGPQQTFLPTAICLAALPIGAQGFLTWFQHSKLRMSSNSMIWLGSFVVFSCSTAYLVFMMLFSRLDDHPLYLSLAAHSGTVTFSGALALIGLMLSSWNATSEEKKLQSEGIMKHPVEVFDVDTPRRVVGKLAFLVAVVPFIVLIPSGLYASAYQTAESLVHVPLEYQGK